MSLLAADTPLHAATAVLLTHAHQQLRKKVKAFQKDGAALHDLRVALRKERSLIRLLAPVSERVLSGPVRRGLRALADASSEARDLQVRTQCLQMPDFRSLPRALVIDLTHRTEQAAHVAEHGFRRVLDKRWPEIERGMARLAEPERSSDPSAPADLRAVAARLWQEQRPTLAQLLSALENKTPSPEWHAARIKAKRLRYGLELLAEVSPDAITSVTDHPALELALHGLGAIQDHLGRLHDLELFALWLTETAEADAHAGKRPPVALNWAAAEALKLAAAQREQWMSTLGPRSIKALKG